MSEMPPESKSLRPRYPAYPEAQHQAGSSNLPHYMEDEEESAINLAEYWHVLVVRRWTIVAVLLSVAAGTSLYTYTQIPMYQATARIQVDLDNPNIVTFQDVYDIETTSGDMLQTQYEILRARTLARRVIEDLQLLEHAEFQPADPGIIGTFRQSLIQFAKGLFATETEATVDPDETDELRGVTNAYLGRLTVAPFDGTRLVDISFDATDPEFAARVINGHASHFIQQNLQFKYDATQEASAFLEGQLITLQANLEKAEDNLQSYSVANDILFTGEGLNTATEKLAQLQNEHTEALTDRFQKEAYDGLIQSGSAAALPQLKDNGLIPNLAIQLVDLQTREAELGVTFAPEYPARQRLRSQIGQIEQSIETETQRVIETVKSELTTAVERERLLDAAVESQSDTVNQINAELIQYNILKREVDSNRQVYDGLLNRLKEAGILAGLGASNIRIVDRAEPLYSPVRPQRSRNLLLGLVAGLVLGAGLAFFQEYMDNSIKSPDEIIRHLRLPAIATIPKQSSLSGRYGYEYGSYGYVNKDETSLESQTSAAVELIAHESPQSLMAEAYRSLRTSLLLSSADHPPRTILVTSYMPSEGKTVTATNVAISLAQTGSRVVLVDADLRKPRIQSLFALGPKPGLPAVLTGNVALREAIHEVSIPNLFVVPCGVIPPNPAELLMSNRFRRVLVALREYFDYVVIDSPPLAHVADARILSSQTDSTLLVIKAHGTTRQSAAHAVDRLNNSNARIAGVVLNDMDVRIKGYGYDIYYSDYGGYSRGYPAAS